MPEYAFFIDDNEHGIILDYESKDYEKIYDNPPIYTPCSENLFSLVEYDEIITVLHVERDKKTLSSITMSVYMDDEVIAQKVWRCFDYAEMAIHRHTWRSIEKILSMLDWRLQRVIKFVKRYLPPCLIVVIDTSPNKPIV